MSNNNPAPVSVDDVSASPPRLIVADTTIALHVALKAYGPRYGVDWVYHDDRLGYLPAMPVKTREELDAALPERAPVSAGGDAELVARLKVAGRALFRERKVYFEDLETVLDVIEYLERLAATPAAPVGADWVVVPRNPNDSMHYAGGRCLGSDAGAIERADRVYRAMLAAAPTPGVEWDEQYRQGVIARDHIERWMRCHPRAVKLLHKGVPFFVIKAEEPYAWGVVRLIRANEGDAWTPECQQWAEDAIGSPEPAEARGVGDDLIALQRFAVAIIGDDVPGDLEGSDIQDTAVECGLLTKEERDAPCGEDCGCAESVGEQEFPLTCYRYAGVYARAMRADHAAALAANKPAGEDLRGHMVDSYLNCTRQAQAQGSEAAHAQAGEGSNG